MVVVQTFTSTTIIDAIGDLTVHGTDVRAVMTYRGPVREKSYLDFFADIGWLKVPAYPSILYMSKKLRYRKANDI